MAGLHERRRELLTAFERSAAAAETIRLGDDENALVTALRKRREAFEDLLIQGVLAPPDESTVRPAMLWPVPVEYLRFMLTGEGRCDATMFSTSALVDRFFTLQNPAYHETLARATTFDGLGLYTLLAVWNLWVTQRAKVVAMMLAEDIGKMHPQRYRAELQIPLVVRRPDQTSVVVYPHRVEDRFALGYWAEASDAKAISGAALLATLKQGGEPVPPYTLPDGMDTAKVVEMLVAEQGC